MICIPSKVLWFSHENLHFFCSFCESQWVVFFLFHSMKVYVFQWMCSFLGNSTLFQWNFSTCHQLISWHHRRLRSGHIRDHRWRVCWLKSFSVLLNKQIVFCTIKKGYFTCTNDDWFFEILLYFDEILRWKCDAFWIEFFVFRSKFYAFQVHSMWK